MFRFIVLLGLVAAGQCGSLVVPSPAIAYAAAPAVGAPLVGSITYNAPEVTVVKQPITVQQHEYHYRAVPTFVQPAPLAAPGHLAYNHYFPAPALHTAPLAYHFRK